MTTQPNTTAFRSLPRTLSLGLVAALGLLGSTGCGGGSTTAGDGGNAADAAGGAPGSDAGDAQGDGSACITFSQVTLFAKCRTCHNSTLMGDARSNATVGVDFDVYESARTQAVLAQRYVSLGLMPPPERNTPATDAEKAGLDEWIACGTPR